MDRAFEVEDDHCDHQSKLARRVDHDWELDHDWHFVDALWACRLVPRMETVAACVARASYGRSRLTCDVEGDRVGVAQVELVVVARSSDLFGQVCSTGQEGLAMEAEHRLALKLSVAEALVVEDRILSDNRLEQ